MSTNKKNKEFNPVAFFKNTTSVYPVNAVSIADIRQAILTAQSEQNPQRTTLIRLYKQFYENDAELKSAVEIRKSNVLNKEFYFVDKDNKKVNVPLIESKWIRDYIDCLLDSIFFGYSVPIFHDFDGENFKFIKNDRMINMGFSSQGEYFSTNIYPFSNSFEEISKNSDVALFCDIRPIRAHYYKNDKDLGLLQSIVPLCIAKNILLSATMQAGQELSTNYKVYKYDESIKNEEEKKQLVNEIFNMFNSGQLVLPLTDEFELLDNSNLSNAIEFYKPLIEYFDKKITNVILGTNIEEAGSFAKASVQADVMKQIVASDCKFIETVFNTYFINDLINYFGFKLDGLRFVIDNSEQISMDQKISLLSSLVSSGQYDVDVTNFEKLGIVLKKKDVQDLGGNPSNTFFRDYE